MSFLPKSGHGVCMARVMLGLQPTTVEAYRGLYHPAEQVVGEGEKGGFVFAQCSKPVVSAKHYTCPIPYLHDFHSIWVLGPGGGGGPKGLVHNLLM